MFIDDLFNSKKINEDWKEFKSRAGEVAKKTADSIVSAGSAASDAVSGALDVIPRPFDEKTYQDRVPKSDPNQDRASKPYPQTDGTKKTNETSKQDQLHQRHQQIRKQSGKPHPDYYKELRATFDLPDDERWTKTAELKKKYNVKESLRPGERHHFEVNPKTGKREYKGIRGERTDAPNKRDSSGDAAERADRERRAHIQHDRRMTESGVEETYGGQLHTKHKKNRFKQIKKIKQTQRKAHGFSGLDESGCTMTEEGRSCPMHGLAECPGYGMTEGSTDDSRFQKMMGNIQKSTPTLVTGYIALEFASERKSKKIKGVTRNGKPIPDVINDPEEELSGKIEFTPDQIEQQLMSIGQKYGWDSIEPGQGRGYTEMFFETSREYTSDDQNLLAANIVKTVNAINKFFNSMNSSLQATGLPGYTTSVWQGMGPPDDINEITDLSQMASIAKSTVAKSQAKNTRTSDDVGVELGNAILAHYKEFGPDGGYSSSQLNQAANIAKIYITQGERAGLQAQMKSGVVGEMIDELISDAGLSGIRTIWESEKSDPGTAIGKMILKYISRYEAENDELGYDPQAFTVAKAIANTYITQGERAGLKAQGSEIAVELGVSEMIDELLSDAGASGLRTIWELDETQGVAEARKGDTNFGSTVTHGSWVVYDGSKVKRFKTRDGAKAYAEKNGGKVASSEFYADNVQKQGVAEAVNEDVERYVEALSRAGYEVNEEKVRLDPKCWKGKKIGSPKTKMKGGVRVNNCVPK